MRDDNFQMMTFALLLVILYYVSDFSVYYAALAATIFLLYGISMIVNIFKEKKNGSWKDAKDVQTTWP